MKTMLIIVALGIFFIASLSSVHAYEAFHGPNDLIYYDKAKAFNGYTLFSPGLFPYIFLIDMEGNVVHSWFVPDKSWDCNPQLLDNANVFYRGGGREKAGGYREVDWNAKPVWKWDCPREDLSVHHDQIRIFNKKINAYTTMGIVMKTLSRENALASGADPEKCTSDSSPDGLIEIDMKGNIIWEWWSWDHTVQDFDSTKEKYVGEGKTIADHPGKLDMNWGRGVRRDLVHFNSLDYNPILDQVVANASTQSEFWVIDHGATFIPGDYEQSKKLAEGPRGNILFRWGNPSVYGAGKGPSYEYGISSLGDQQVFFTHDIQWIKQGLPGAGHFLLFDNNSRRPGPTFSRLIEVNPYDGPMENGVYVHEIKAGHQRNGKSDQIVWDFNSGEPNSFYSRNISGTQRLPNGNTLACSGRHGHFFEVTKEGEVVWEYIQPVSHHIRGGTPMVFTSGMDVSDLTAGMEAPPGGSITFHTFRCYRYGANHPGLEGKDLTPKGKITELWAAGKLPVPEIEPEPEGKRKGRLR